MSFGLVGANPTVGVYAVVVQLDRISDFGSEDESANLSDSFRI